MNARKIYDEPNALSGILDNKLFVAILAGEAVLQVRASNVPGPTAGLPCPARVTCARAVVRHVHAASCVRTTGSDPCLVLYICI